MHGERQQWTNFINISERICESLLKYRENVFRDTANINMVKNVLAAPTVTHLGGKLDFKCSSKIIDCLRCLY